MPPNSLGCLIIAVSAVALTACEKPSSSIVGTLERDRVELIAEQQEPILEISVREGQAVSSGQPVLRLDDSRTRQSIAAAQARLVGAEAALKTAQVSLRRAQSLTKQGLASRSELDRAQADADSALAARDSAKANVDELQVTVDRLVVRAPRDGVIDSLPFKLGDRPPPGAAVAVLLAGTPYARVYVPEGIRSRVNAGTTAHVNVDGQPNAFNGRVRTISSDAAFTPYFALTEHDRGRLVYLAEIDLTDPAAEKLPTGMPVTVDFSPPAEKQ